ncbi:MATE family efflux transporter [Coprococcus sp. AF21-14LB]|uniref:MATE family efflux transporter n=1 Tax=Coprococcus sp. AF21-14LB TaxID=2292231 RepID=UPI000E4E6204|nr:MATE family efflux transporter [Coprococcus sp. AF21-14LB]RGS76436.1 hypothetical protein DWX73_12180 [Coprococcus sp. AF21-14LB]
MSGKTVDMTKGPILRQMSTFALPVLLGMLCQRVYNFADVYIVGKYLGDQALAAVSISGVVMYLLFSLMMGLTTGVNVVISQYYGSGNQQKVKATFTSSAFVAFGFALLITIVGVLTAVPTLKLMQTSEELLEAATSYLMIIYLGGTSTMLYNWIAAVLRSLGNSFVPFIFLIISSVLNIFFRYCICSMDSAWDSRRSACDGVGTIIFRNCMLPVRMEVISVFKTRAWNVPVRS